MKKDKKPTKKKCCDCMQPVEFEGDDWCPWCLARRASE